MSASSDSRSCTISGWLAATATSRAVCADPNALRYGSRKEQTGSFVKDAASHLSLVFLGVESARGPQPLRSCESVFSQPLGGVDVQNADEKIHDLVRTEDGNFHRRPCRSGICLLT